MLVGQNRIGIFFYLFRRFKISFIRPIVVVFTIVSRVFTTDGRPRIVKSRNGDRPSGVCTSCGPKGTKYRSQ